MENQSIEAQQAQGNRMKGICLKFCMRMPVDLGTIDGG